MIINIAKKYNYTFLNEYKYFLYSSVPYLHYSSYLNIVLKV